MSVFTFFYRIFVHFDILSRVFLSARPVMGNSSGHSVIDEKNVEESRNFFYFIKDEGH